MPAEPSLTDLRRAYAEALGLDEPIPEPALEAIAADPTYARRLFACRGSSQMLGLMLSRPPEVAQMPSVSAMAATAGAALVRWTQSGFTVVDDVQLSRRLSACSACPNLVAPASTLQKLVSVGTRDDRICRLCGCPVERKARLPHESCPAPDSDDPSLNRWGEPRVAVG
jgi:hypothetical protein